MFLRFDLMDRDAVTLKFGGSNGDFAMLFVKIQDVFGILFFKTNDDKKARRMIKKNARRRLTFVIS